MKYLFGLLVAMISPWISVAQQKQEQIRNPFFICETEQLPNVSDIIGAANGTNISLKEAISNEKFNEIYFPNNTINSQVLQLALSSNAWKKHHGLPGSTDDEIRIGVVFLDGDDSQRDLVKKYAPQWTGTNGAKVKFIFDDRSKEHIRITFTGGNRSKVGWHASKVKGDAPTMWLEAVRPSGLLVLSEDEKKEIKRVILHEFGHALGLEHEHKHPASGLTWKKQVIYKYFQETSECSEMTKEECEKWVNFNIIDKYSVSYVCPGAPAFDEKSIMIYLYPPEWAEEKNKAVTIQNCRMEICLVLKICMNASIRLH